MTFKSMKAITLWQPWASLIAVGAKKYETRSWATNYRGPIAIHAAAKRPSTLREIWEHSIRRMKEALGLGGDDCIDSLPRGAVVATAELVGCWKMERHGIINASGCLRHYEELGENELLFGDWTPGRYAWELANVQMLPEPIAAKGKQGLWNWESEGVA